MADTPRMRALRDLAGQMPVMNQRAATGLAAARDIQLQQQVGAAPTSTPPAAAQNLGAAQATQAATQQVEQVQSTTQQAAALGAAGQQAAAAGQQARGFDIQQGLQDQNLQNQTRLGKISESAKREILDSRLQFQADEAGRTLLNERQLADFARMSAVSDEQMRNYQQQAEQTSKLNMQAQEAAYNKLVSILSNEHEMRQLGLNSAQKRDLLSAKQGLEDKIARDKAAAANKGAIWGTVGTVVGAVAGGVFGGPGGAAAGAAVGGGLGRTVGSGMG